MGKLADELKKRFKTPQEVARVLGIDPALLSAAKLAFDAKRGRDGALLDDNDPEMKLARNLSGQAFETAQIKHDRELEHAMADDDEEDRDEYDDDRDEDDAAEQRAKRRWAMHRFGDACVKNGMSLDEIRAMFADMPEPATAGGMGGALAEDIETVMSRLTGMGGSSTTGPGYEDSPKAGDRRRQRAHDRKLALDAKRERNFLRRFPEAARLQGRPGDFANYGDREPEPMAMDERQSAEDYDRANAWFGLDRIKTNAV